jgi:hypothetical protein
LTITRARLRATARQRASEPLLFHALAAAATSFLYVDAALW